jgi:hypothetical protein
MGERADIKFLDRMSTLVHHTTSRVHWFMTKGEKAPRASRLDAPVIGERERCRNNDRTHQDREPSRQGLQYFGFRVPTAPVYGFTLPVAL